MRRLGALTYGLWFWTLAGMNVVLILGVLALHSLVAKENGLGQRLPSLDAIDRGGRRIVLGNGDHCWAIRFTSAYCPACRQDLAGGWPRLRQVLSRRGCRTYYVQPSILAAATPDDSGSRSEMELWAVTPSFATDSRLVVAPTTVVLDSKGTVVWRHVGALSDSDVGAATHSIPLPTDLRVGMRALDTSGVSVGTRGPPDRRIPLGANNLTLALGPTTFTTKDPDGTQQNPNFGITTDKQGHRIIQMQFKFIF